MLEDALVVATDADYKFDLAIQLGRLEIAMVRYVYFVIPKLSDRFALELT